MAAIADEAGLRDLDRLKAVTAALADPRRTTPEQAEALLARARPFYYFNASLHADETGSAEMALELAYRLAVSEQPLIRRIRERLVVLINPVSEPDGRDKVVDWFYRYLKGRTDYDGLPRVVEPYCHGTNANGSELLRAVQVAGSSGSGAFGFGKLWTVSKMSRVRSRDDRSRER